MRGAPKGNLLRTEWPGDAMPSRSVDMDWDLDRTSYRHLV